MLETLGLSAGVPIAWSWGIVFVIGAWKSRVVGAYRRLIYDRAALVTLGAVHRGTILET